MRCSSSGLALLPRLMFTNPNWPPSERKNQFQGLIAWTTSPESGSLKSGMGPPVRATAILRAMHPGQHRIDGILGSGPVKLRRPRSVARDFQETAMRMPASFPLSGVRRGIAVVATTFLAIASHAASVPPVGAENGMVVTAQHLASKVGVDVLKKGGNAIDAAVAVGYALAVVYPAAGNLGGGGFMTIPLADGRQTFIDFREKAPLAATADMYLDKDGNVIKGASTGGHLAVGVPGTVAGMQHALATYGTLKRGEVIAPAIALADRGFVLEQGDIDLLATATEGFRKDPATAAIFLNH